MPLSVPAAHYSPMADLLEKALGVTFDDRNLLRIAVTHSSLLNELPGAAPECNERQEFLGDAVLGMVVAEELYKRFPDEQEGALTSMRSNIVRGETLADAARRIELGKHLLMGAGEVGTGGLDRASNLAAAFEAIVGALFLDQGYEEARSFCLRVLDEEIASASVSPSPTHPKSALQELVQGRGLPAPKYSIIDASGQPHAPIFTAEVLVEGETLGRGTGRSKSLAEQEAAKAALADLTKNG